MHSNSDSLLPAFKAYIVHLIRAPALATALFFLLQPWFNVLYGYCTRDWSVSDRLFVTCLLWATHVFIYRTVNSFFYICDEHRFFRQYKLPRNAHQIPSRELIRRTVKSAVIGQLFIDPLGIYFIVVPIWMRHQPSMVYETAEIRQHALYYVWLVYAKFVCCDIFNSVLFYVAHRLLHTKYLYASVHKQHHEYSGTIGFAAEYAHPLESLFANFIPTLFGCVCCAAHPLQFAIWLAWRLQATYEGHSGYAFHGTWLHRIGLTHADDALFHDFHHSKNVGNYTPMFFDALFGSDKAWNEWRRGWLKSKYIKYHVDNNVWESKGSLKTS